MNEPDDNRRIFDQGGTGTLIVDGKEVDKWDETFDVGVDSRTPIDDRDYQVPFRFTGKLVKLTVELHPIKATPRPDPDGQMAHTGLGPVRFKQIPPFPPLQRGG